MSYIHSLGIACTTITIHTCACMDRESQTVAQSYGQGIAPKYIFSYCPQPYGQGIAPKYIFHTVHSHTDKELHQSTSFHTVHSHTDKELHQSTSFHTVHSHTDKELHQSTSFHMSNKIMITLCHKVRLKHGLMCVSRTLKHGRVH